MRASDFDAGTLIDALVRLEDAFEQEVRDIRNLRSILADKWGEDPDLLTGGMLGPRVTDLLTSALNTSNKVSPMRSAIAAAYRLDGMKEGTK